MSNRTRTAEDPLPFDTVDACVMGMTRHIRVICACI